MYKSDEDDTGGSFEIIKGGVKDRLDKECVEDDWKKSIKTPLNPQSSINNSRVDDPDPH